MSAPEDPSPLGPWSRLYWLLALALAAQVAAYAWLTGWASS